MKQAVEDGKDKTRRFKVQSDTELAALDDSSDNVAMHAIGYDFDAKYPVILTRHQK